MYLLIIIPIAKAINKENLTYFSSLEVSLGSIVEIPLRSKMGLGIVISCVNATEKKSSIKNLSYQIKKIEKIQSTQFLLPEFILGASSVADYYATTTGSVLSSLIPKNIISNLKTLAPIETSVKTQPQHAQEVLVLQSNDDERYATYKSYIREEFARNGSVFFCLPTIEDIKNAKLSLQKGIEQYTFILHNGLTKKEILDTWQKAITISHPILIIATGYFFSLPRVDIKTIIVENESSRAYNSQSRPYIDMRTVALILAKKMGSKVIFGDMSLRVETLWKQKNDEYAELSPLKFRSTSNSQCLLVDARIPKDQIKKEFSMFTKELRDLIQETKKTNENIFLFCGRKGLSPLTVCADCGTIVYCNECGAPVVLYGKKTITKELLQAHAESVNFFSCHKCGTKRDAGELCKKCNSWKLTPLGIGIESAEKEFKKIFPDMHIFVMDKDRIKTHKQAVVLVEKFYDTPGGVLLGTELALSYLKKKIGNAGVVSLDAFFSIPDFRINEKIMRIILSIKTLAERKVVIQTRSPDQSVFQMAIKGNLADFYREEIEQRKEVGYPPFNVFIKITLEGPKLEVRKRMEELKNFLKPFELTVFQAFHPGLYKKYTVHGLIMVPREKWPEGTLVEKLRALPFEYAVKIDPDTLL